MDVDCDHGQVIVTDNALRNVALECLGQSGATTIIASRLPCKFC